MNGLCVLLCVRSYPDTQMDVNTGRMRPKLFTIGSTFKTETKALKACEDAATRRDRGPPPPEVDGLDSALSVGFGSSFRGDMSVDDGAASVATNPRMARLRGMQSSSRSVMSTASASSVGSRSSKLSSRKGRRKGKKQGPPYLETHYTVVVVSELFEHKTLREQLTMVYRVLHEVSLVHAAVPGKQHCRAAPTAPQVSRCVLLW